METIDKYLMLIADIIDLIGVAILLFGFLKMLIKYVVIEFGDLMSTPIKKLQKIRCEMGIYILMALDFLIASDIINTVTDLNQEQLIELSIMIVLRTAIGYFLAKEVAEIEKTEEHI